jgi:hypothetical protein
MRRSWAASALACCGETSKAWKVSDYLQMVMDINSEDYT